jgi:hypothetical protein
MRILVPSQAGKRGLCALARCGHWEDPCGYDWLKIICPFAKHAWCALVYMAASHAR